MNEKEAKKLLDEERVYYDHFGPPYAHNHPFTKGREHIREQVDKWDEARRWLKENEVI